MTISKDDEGKVKKKSSGSVAAWLLYLAVLALTIIGIQQVASRETVAEATRQDAPEGSSSSSSKTPDWAGLAAELAAEKEAAKETVVEAGVDRPPKRKAASGVAKTVTKTGKETVLKPMWGLDHDPDADVIMSLGFGYQRREFARFISTLRRAGYGGDIVLATEPEERMKKGVADYLKSQSVLAYGFTYECVKKGVVGRRRLLVTPGGCWLTNWYADKDNRGPRPLALARYEMYRSWLLKYSTKSWGIIFDFRDTYFQANPLARVDRSKGAPNLLLFAENRLVKTVGNCVFNSGWLRCWGRDVPKRFSNNSVVCSGSTLGSRDALYAYSERMIEEFDKQQCHLGPTHSQSDQGYHNFLYHSGAFKKLPGVRIAHHEQGHGGLVNTIGAMNGYRVPKHMKGPLDTHWKIRDEKGFLYEYDGTLSAAIHQWDRFGKELTKFIDSLVNEYESRSPNDRS